MFILEDFDLKLDTEVIGRNFAYIEEIESTNSYLLDPANELTADGTVLLAEKQLKGRGRLNRQWNSLAGQNLTFSILLKRKFSEKKLNLINFSAALAVAFSLENLYQLRINLKWPNDVLVNGEKISGILLESSTKGEKINRVVVGIGLNINQVQFPQDFAIPPTSVKKEINQDANRERLLSEILNNFEDLLNRISDDSEGIFNDWKARCRMLGEKIMVKENDNVKTGIFEDLDERGFLLLKKDDGEIERIHYGDVSLR